MQGGGVPQAFLHLRRELEAIFLRLLGDPRRAGEAALRLLGDPGEIELGLVLRYFLACELDGAQAQNFWRALMAYRQSLREQFGDRVSLHITLYHFMRDPQALAAAGLSDKLRCGGAARRIAFLEMRGWWECNSRTGLHRPAVMVARLEQELRAALARGASTGLLLLAIEDVRPLGRESPAPPPLRAELLRIIGEHVMDTCRGSDIVGHLDDNHLEIILPGTDLKGATVLAQRLRKMLETMDLPCTFSHRCALACCPQDAAGAREFFEVTLDALRAGNVASGAPLRPRTRPGSWARRIQWRVVWPARRIVRNPVGGITALLLVLSIGWFAHYVSELSFKTAPTWRVLGYFVAAGDNAPAFESSAGWSDGWNQGPKRGAGMILSDGQRVETEVVFPGRLRLSGGLQLPLRSALVLEITPPTGGPPLQLKLSRRDLRFEFAGGLIAWEDARVTRYEKEMAFELAGTNAHWNLAGREGRFPLPLTLKTGHKLRLAVSAVGPTPLHLGTLRLEGAAALKEDLAPVFVPDDFQKLWVALAEGAPVARENFSRLERQSGSAVARATLWQGLELAAVHGKLEAVGMALADLLQREAPCATSFLEENMKLMEPAAAARLAGLMKDHGEAELGARVAVLSFHEAAQRGEVLAAWRRAKERAGGGEAALQILAVGALSLPATSAMEADEIWEGLDGIHKSAGAQSFFAARAYLERASARGQHSSEALRVLFQNWEEDPLWGYEFCRELLTALPAQEASRLCERAGEGVDSNPLGSLVMAELMLKSDPASASRALRLLLPWMEGSDFSVISHRLRAVAFQALGKALEARADLNWMARHATGSEARWARERLHQLDSSERHGSY